MHDRGVVITHAVNSLLRPHTSVLPLNVRICGGFGLEIVMPNARTSCSALLIAPDCEGTGLPETD